MGFFTPWDVVTSHRKVAFLVFFVLIVGYMVLAIFSAKDVFENYSDPVVVVSVRNSAPKLPYMYVCPSSIHYSFSRVAAGCGEDVLRKLEPASNSDGNLFIRNGKCINVSQVPLAAGSSNSFVTDGNCSMGIAKIKVLDRLLRGPLELTCVTFFFRYPEVVQRIDWLGEFYVLYELTLNQTNPLPESKQRLISPSLVAYFSDIGNETLETGGCFIRSKDARGLSNSPERFEQGGVLLPQNRRSDFSVVRRKRRMLDGVDTVQYFVDSGGVISYEVGDGGIVAALAPEHNLTANALQGLRGVLMQVGINFDEIEERENGIKTGLYLLLGTLGGQWTWFTAALGLIFIEIRDGPFMTLALPWVAIASLFRRDQRAARQAAYGESPSAVENLRVVNRADPPPMSAH